MGQVGRHNVVGQREMSFGRSCASYKNKIPSSGTF